MRRRNRLGDTRSVNVGTCTHETRTNAYLCIPSKEHPAWLAGPADLRHGYCCAHRGGRMGDRIAPPQPLRRRRQRDRSPARHVQAVLAAAHGDPALLKTLPAGTLHALQDSLIAGISTAYYLAGGILIGGALLAYAMLRHIPASDAPHTVPTPTRGPAGAAADQPVRPTTPTSQNHAISSVVSRCLVSMEVHKNERSS
jgi:hypothetical protein